MIKHLFIFCLIFMPSTITLAATSNSLCRSNEFILFSCKLYNKKTASLCMPKSKNNTTSNIIYRYGTIRKIEINLKNKTDEITFYKNIGPTNGGTQKSIWIANHDYNYIIFSRDGFYQGEYYVRSGLHSEKNNKSTFHNECTSYEEFRNEDVFNELPEKSQINQNDN